MNDKERNKAINRAWGRYLVASDKASQAREAYFAALEAEQEAYNEYRDVRFPVEPVEGATKP